MKDLNIQLPRHTVVVMCGPTMCGKSTLGIESFLMEKAFLNYNVQYISSDGLRHQLLGGPLQHRHSPQMLSVSRQAFDLLFAHLRAAVSYPVNADYVIVDTRGAQEEFRQQVVDIAKSNGYGTAIVTFEYKNRDDYTRYCVTDEERSVVEADVRRYLRNVLPSITVKQWDKRVRIQHRDQEVNFEPAPDAFARTVLTYEKGQAVAVIGDTHECVKELADLVNKVEEKYGTDTRFVQLGDYLDKGGDTEQILLALSLMLASGRLTVLHGNHEHYLYRRLKGELEPNPEIEAQHFTALAVLEANEALAKLFFTIYEQSVPFVKLVSEGARDVIVTHAPCENKHLGKFSFEALRSQRNFFFKDREAPVKDALPFVYKEADFSHPIHVFGHVAHRSESLMFKNKVFLDTGAVHGGKLSAFVMKGNRYDFVQVDSRQRTQEGIDKRPDNLTTVEREQRKFNIHDYDLSKDDMRLVRSVMANGTRYISGTMPPAPSSDSGLETLDAAFDYFRRKGVKELVLQPKYMGSRCQMYLFRDQEKKSFCVSRKGWVIRKVEGMEDLLAEWHTKAFSASELQSIVLDGELLPWKALGEGLIDHHFKPYGALVGDELATLADDYTFRNMKIGNDFSPAQRLLDLSFYDEALALYAGDAPLEFKPFDILLVDGQRYPGSAYTGFALFNQDKQFVVDLHDDENMTHAQAFYLDLTVKKGMEGVVAKPLEPQDGVIPYMKIRNPEYLRLVYGYDYLDREDKLIRQKNISGKAATAIREHKLAMEMLTADDDRRQELVVKMIAELRKEADFDPRL